MFQDVRAGSPGESSLTNESKVSHRDRHQSTQNTKLEYRKRLLPLIIRIPETLGILVNRSYVKDLANPSCQKLCAHPLNLSADVAQLKMSPRDHLSGLLYKVAGE